MPQLIIGMGRVIYQIKALGDLNDIKKFNNFFLVSRKTGLKFMIFGLISNEYGVTDGICLQ